MNEPAVLIMGALTGIGRAAALAFAKDGARPVISGRREAEGKALEAELRRLGAGAAFIQADVRRDDEVSNLLDKTVARFGRLQLRRGCRLPSKAWPPMPCSALGSASERELNIRSRRYASEYPALIRAHDHVERRIRDGVAAQDRRRRIGRSRIAS